MTDSEALAEAIRRTGITRYRFLCSADNTLGPPNDPATWRRFMHILAGATPPPRPITVDYGIDPDAPRPCGGCP
jgi:hypothetical protein